MTLGATGSGFSQIVLDLRLDQSSRELSGDYLQVSYWFSCTDDQTVVATISHFGGSHSTISPSDRETRVVGLSRDFGFCPPITSMEASLLGHTF